LSTFQTAEDQDTKNLSYFEGITRIAGLWKQIVEEDVWTERENEVGNLRNCMIGKPGIKHSARKFTS
jgi:hypothetical protein